jgi:predicted GIY-YIG superfamily endonuclease
MYFVYLIKSITFPEQVYVGFTKDVDERLRVHNAGSSSHTSKYKPWKLHAYFAFISQTQALVFEKYLKSHAGRAFANKRLW